MSVSNRLSSGFDIEKICNIVFVRLHLGNGHMAEIEFQEEECSIMYEDNVDMFKSSRHELKLNEPDDTFRKMESYNCDLLLSDVLKQSMVINTGVESPN